ncbi:MAG TPA: LETM1 domain-containing protein [Planctomycetota bacterium]|nr:LETM1 domain-containing protein [Planctomycetota bacterium]HPY74807.1 LETM1 domain-containing protein [Planctomycetota bacterium]HQB00447.1 LETM1 domain-containing protein [Planctomycetota bacterium]
MCCKIRNFFKIRCLKKKVVDNKEFREKEFFPKLKDMLHDNWNKVKIEISESDEMLRIFLKYLKQEEVTPEEEKAVKTQLKDIAKIVPALGIFMLPGGSIFLPVLAKILPWDLMPTAFQKEALETLQSPEEEDDDSIHFAETIIEDIQ